MEAGASGVEGTTQTRWERTKRRFGNTSKVSWRKIIPKIK